MEYDSPRNITNKMHDHMGNPIKIGDIVTFVDLPSTRINYLYKDLIGKRLTISRIEVKNINDGPVVYFEDRPVEEGALAWRLSKINTASQICRWDSIVEEFSQEEQNE